MHKNREKLYALFVVALLITAVTFFHLNWLQKDTRYQPFVDPYPSRTLAFVDSFAEDGLAHLPERIEALGIGPRPPLYQMIAAIFVTLFGRSIDAMLGANLLLNGVLIVASFAAGSLVKNRAAGLLGALFVATYPPLANLVRIARPHSVAPAAVALWLWAGLLLLRDRSWQNAWFFSLSLAFCFLIHPNLFYMLGLPTILFCLYLVFFQEQPQSDAQTNTASAGRIRPFSSWLRRKLGTPFIYKGLAPSLLVAGILTASWYLPNLNDVTNLVEISAAGWTTTRYGFGNFPASSWWYALTFPGAISTLFATLLIISLFVYLFARQRLPFVLVVTFLLMYAGFGLRQGTLAWMNFAPILPVAAVITAVFLIDFWEQTRRKQAAAKSIQVDRVFAIILLIASIAAAGFNFYVVTGNVTDNGKLTAELLGAPLDTACGWRMTVAFCFNPPRQQDWLISEMLQRPLNDPECQEKDCTLAVATESAESFSFAMLSYHLIRDYPEFRLNVVPIRLHGQKYSLDWLKSDYLMYIPEIQNNSYANAVSRFLMQPPASFATHFQEVAEVSLPKGWTAVVFKRSRPLTDEEINTYADMLDVPANVRNNLDINFSFLDNDE